jgi:hypothetical protein
LYILEIGFVFSNGPIISYVRIRSLKSFIKHGLTRINTDFFTTKASAFAKATADRLRYDEQLDRITGLTEFLPAGADLAAAFSIPVSAKPAAIVRWAILMARIRICRPAKRDLLVIYPLPSYITPMR